MGSEIHESAYNSNDWQIIETYGSRTTLINAKTQRKIQSYEWQSDEYNLHEIYLWRKSIPKEWPIVNICYYQTEKGLFSDQYLIKVFTSPLKRLSQVTKLKKSEAIGGIGQIIQALKILFQKFGYFNVSLHNIGFDEEGRVKVWVNQNFAKNFLQQQQKIITVRSNTELSITNNIIRMIKSRVSNKDVNNQYPYSKNFDQVIQYCKNRREEIRHPSNQYVPQTIPSYSPTKIQPINYPMQRKDLPNQPIIIRVTPPPQKLERQQSLYHLQPQSPQQMQMWQQPVIIPTYNKEQLVSKGQLSTSREDRKAKIIEQQYINTKDNFDYFGNLELVESVIYTKRKNR